MPAYPQWTDREWNNLITLCRQDGIPLNAEEVREAAFGYMRNGSDGGGNQWGIAGTCVALNVDRIARGD